ncbi:Alpha/Beta hydrolase protein [Sporodiniella umbellata]|nr:Alpha/Beta hydrolase protein [Sporodiniella umbellata]
MILKSTLIVLFGAFFVMGESFKPEHLIELPISTVPVASPNGSLAAFSQSVYNIQDGKSVRNLHLLNIKTNEVHALTEPSYTSGDSEPFFLDDDHLAYFHHQEGEAVDQLYVLDLKNKKSYPLTDFPIAFGDLKYNVQHKLLVFSAAVYEDGSIDGAVKRDKETEETKKDSGVVFDTLMVRHWDKFVTKKKNNLFAVSLSFEAGKYEISGEPLNLLKNTGLESPLFALGDASNYAISPDASHVAFIAKTPERDNAWQTSAHLHLVSTRGGHLKTINGDIPAASSSPLFLSDDELVYFQMRVPQYESDRNRITIYNIKTEERRVVAEDWDSSPEEVASDGKQLFVTAASQGHKKMFSIDLETQEINELTHKYGSSSPQVLPSGKILLGISSYSQPSRPHVLDPSTKHIKALGSKLEGIDFSEAEEFRFKGANDEEVHGWYLKPTNFESHKRYPVAFLIHGGPQGAFTNSWSQRWNPQIFASAGYAVVAINFHGSTGYGQDFTDSIGGNWGTLPYEDLEIGLDYVLNKYSYLDPERVAGLGASYGGYMINWLNGHSKKFKVFVNHDGIFSTTQAYYNTDELYFPERDIGGSPIDPKNRENFEKFSPANFVHNWKTPTLFIHEKLCESGCLKIFFVFLGGLDFRLTLAESLSAFTALQRQNVQSRLLYFSDENHWVTKSANSLRWHREGNTVTDIFKY